MGGTDEQTNEIGECRKNRSHLCSTGLCCFQGPCPRSEEKIETNCMMKSCKVRQVDLRELKASRARVEKSRLTTNV